MAPPRITRPRCPGPSRSWRVAARQSPPMFKTAGMRPFRTGVPRGGGSARDDLQHVLAGTRLHRDLDAAVRLAHLPAPAPAVEVDGLHARAARQRVPDPQAVDGRGARIDLGP